MKKNTKIKLTKKTSFAISLAMFFALTLFAIFSNPAKTFAAADSALSFSPASTSTTTGSTFSVVAALNPGSHQISTVELHMTYDQTKLQLNSITAGSSFTQSLGGPTIAGDGTAYIALGTAFGTNITTNPTTVATLSFTALSAVTNSALAFTTASIVAGDDEPGVNELGTRSGGTVTITTADSTPPTFTISDGASSSYVKTDTINIAVSDATGVASRYYGFSTDSTCNASDTIATAFTSGTNFTISGDHSDYLCVKATDSSASANVAYQLVGQLHTDNTAPTVTQTTAVSATTYDTTPNYVFATTEAGTITYAGDCSSSTTAASSGSNTITFSALAIGSHSNCTIKVTDTAGNQSSALAVNTFAVTYPADLNGDHAVNSSDFSVLHTYYGTTNSAADMNSDGKVDGLDFSILHANFGRSF